MPAWLLRIQKEVICITDAPHGTDLFRPVDNVRAGAVRGGRRDKIRCKAAVDEQLPPAGNEVHLHAEGMDRRGLCHDLLMMHMLEIDTDVQSRR